MTLKDLGIDPKSKTGTVSPNYADVAKEIARVNASASYTPAQKMDKVQSLVSEFQKASQAFSAAGGQTLNDRVQFAVVDWLVANRGFKKDTGGAGDKGIKVTDRLVTLIPTASGDHVLTVSGTAVWGIVKGYND